MSLKSNIESRTVMRQLDENLNKYKQHLTEHQDILDDIVNLEYKRKHCNTGEILLFTVFPCFFMILIAVFFSWLMFVEGFYIELVSVVIFMTSASCYLVKLSIDIVYEEKDIRKYKKDSNKLSNEIRSKLNRT